MALDLPYELHELICSHLDPTTLKTYALACHQFHSIAQKLLFSKIELIYPRRTDSPIPRTENLLQLTVTSPQICEYVRRVSLFNGLRDNYADADQENSWYYWDDLSLSSLLLRFAKVKDFGFGGRSLADVYWETIPATVQETLNSILHSNTLVKLALRGVGDLPIDVLDECVALEELSLEFVDFLTQETDLFLAGSWKSAAPHKQKVHLKSLRLALSGTWFPFFSMWITSSACNLDITRLRRFAVLMTATYYDHGHINRILQACAQTLEVCCLSPIFRGANPAITPIDISMLSSLRILRLRLGMVAASFGGDYYQIVGNSYPWISHCLGLITPSHSVTEISVKISLLNERDMFGVQSSINMAMWRPLDTFLASYVINSFRRFKFIALEEEFEDSDAVKKTIAQTFPKLDELKVLTVEMAGALSGFLCCAESEDFIERVEVC